MRAQVGHPVNAAHSPIAIPSNGRGSISPDRSSGARGRFSSSMVSPRSSQIVSASFKQPVGTWARVALRLQQRVHPGWAPSPRMPGSCSRSFQRAASAFSRGWILQSAVRPSDQ